MKTLTIQRTKENRIAVTIRNQVCHIGGQPKDLPQRFGRYELSFILPLDLEKGMFKQVKNVI